MILPLLKKVFVDNVEIKFTTFEYRLFYTLVEGKGKVFSCKQLYEQIFDKSRGTLPLDDESDSIKSLIKRIRKKLGDRKILIENISRAGYRIATLFC